MYTLSPRQCPACQQSFEPGRKNQYYCSAPCRIDANNELAKARYASLGEKTSDIDTLEAELTRLRQAMKAMEAFISALTIVIEGVEEVDQNTIRYQGDRYQAEAKVGRLDLRISVQAGGALKVGEDEIIYRRQRGEHVYRYVRIS